MKHKPDHPKEIEIIIDPHTAPLTLEQREAVEILQGQVFIHGRKAGVHYNTLAITDGPSIESYGVVKSKDCISFCANISTVMGAQYDLEGVIGHEAGHIINDNFIVKQNLNNVVRVKNHLHECQAYLLDRPKETEETLRRQFVTLGWLGDRLDRFEATAVPLLEQLYTRPEVTSASPEKWARMIETGDESYLWMKAKAERLQDAKGLLGLRESFEQTICHLKSGTIPNDKLEAVMMPSPEKESFIQGLKPENDLTPQGGEVRAKITQLLGRMSTYDVRSLSENFAKGDEYAADSHALRTSTAPRALQIALEQIARDFIKKYPDKAHILEVDGREHPSVTRRIKRLDHITDHGVPPADEELRPTASSRPKSTAIDPETLKHRHSEEKKRGRS